MRRVWHQVIVCLAAVAAAAQLHAYEVNAWPAVVFEDEDSGATRSWTGLGPLLFSQPSPEPDAGRVYGLRPLWVRFDETGVEKTDLLYPLFFYRQYPDNYTWSILQLVNGSGRNTLAPREAGPPDKHFDIWPFYFSHETPDPQDTYHALLPIYGTIKYRLGYRSISWAPFPLFVQTVKSHGKVTYTPWPIVRTYSGGENGFALWPLFGSTRGPGVARHFFAAWPLFWDNTLDIDPDAPPGAAPGTQVGFLPFYTRDTAPGSISENFLWPFFGYTSRTIPSDYHERRYFWPFLVQGHGKDKVVERIAPLYTFSEYKGSTSTWNIWPLFHNTTWADSDTRQSKTQVFYFLYWSLDQTSVSRPDLAPAFKRHVWPLLSVWDNGAGSRQLQIPSPLEVFFNDNADIRQVWTPLFALYRYDHRPDGVTTDSLLWNAVTWRRGASGALDEFHLGPLLGMRHAPEGARWRILGFDFAPNLGKNNPPAK